MAGNYSVNLPAPEVPRNALLDFSPINKAIDSNRQNVLQTRQLDMRQDEQTYQRGRDTKQDARLEQQDMRQKIEWYGKQASSVAGLQGQQRVAGYQRLLARHKIDFPGETLTPEEMDPMTGPELLAAQSGKYFDPRDSQAKDLELQKTTAEIAKLNAQAANGGSEYGKAPMGYRFGERGELHPIPGGPGDELNETESKDALFAERMLRSETDLDLVIPIDENGNFTKYNPTTWRQAVFPDKGVAANLLNSKEWQQYQRTSRESSSAILRKDTGAAVTDEEFNTYFPTYFPIPGDSPQVVKQKKAAREAAASGLKGASSRAFDRMYPDYSKRPQSNGPPGNTAQPGVPKPGEVLRGHRFKGGDPSDRNSWERM